MKARSTIAAAILLLSSGCAGRGSGLPPLTGGSNGAGIFDASAAGCNVSSDGLIWYTVPAGDFPPLDIAREQCSASALENRGTPPIPHWAVPSGPTRAIFVATSLQEKLPLGGMQILESIAQAHHVPVTWMVGSSAYLLDISPYIAGHAQNGDDVEAEPGLEGTLAADFAWYRPSVSVQVGGTGRNQRDPAAQMPLGEDAFWGIAWNSHGIDGLDDLGAPWGSYCADVASFKRPSPDGSCALLAFEWTARDLTRAYLSGEEAAFSTDPDDLQLRGGFSTKAAQQYAASLVDAYAAAGQTAPLVMVAQQESQEMFNNGDPQIMDAEYARAVADGMKPETLAQAAVDARAFSAQPRAVAFPFAAGGNNVASPLIGGETIYPATIDYHDAASGMTFLGGHTTPSRVFRYADYPISTDEVPLPQVPQQELPALTNVAAASGTLSFQFDAPVALHYGIALWTDPAALGLSGSNVHFAGHARAVITFDLQPGLNQVSVRCTGCTSTTFPYAL